MDINNKLLIVLPSAKENNPDRFSQWCKNCAKSHYYGNNLVVINPSIYDSEITTDPNGNADHSKAIEKISVKKNNGNFYFIYHGSYDEDMESQWKDNYPNIIFKHYGSEDDFHKTFVTLLREKANNGEDKKYELNKIFTVIEGETDIAQKAQLLAYCMSPKIIKAKEKEIESNFYYKDVKDKIAELKEMEDYKDKDKDKDKTYQDIFIKIREILEELTDANR